MPKKIYILFMPSLMQHVCSSLILLIDILGGKRVTVTKSDFMFDSTMHGYIMASLILSMLGFNVHTNRLPL
jgi:hypothetical protein